MNLKPKKLVGEHEFYCCGARVLIKDGEIRVLTEPRIAYCPLHESLYGTKVWDKEAVKLSVSQKIRGHGFCCEQRSFDGSIVVPYGSSEIISVCMKKGLIDCAVTVCDGTGTVITNNADLVQAIGARLTGIVRTSPIKSTIEYMRANSGVVLDESKATIDQCAGVSKAADLGYRHIAVTVASFNSEALKKIREVEKEKGISVAVFSVCNTCADEADVERISANADIACTSASRLVRERIGPKALMQLGVTIPVFALTNLGKSLLLSYLMEFNEGLVAFRTKKMPYIAEGRGPRLKE